MSSYGDSEQALAEAEARLFVKGDDVEALRVASFEHYRQGNFERARVLLGRYIAVSGSDATAFEYLARSQIIVGQKDAAVEVLEEYIKHPRATATGLLWARERLMQLVSGAGQAPPEEEAPETAAPEEEAPPPAPEPAPAPAPAPAPEPAPAASAPEESPAPPARKKVMPNSVIEALEKRQIITHLGYVDEGQLDTARTQFEKEPDNPMVIEWYAFMLYSAGENDEAIELYERIFREFEPGANTFYQLGNAHLRKLELKQAVKYWVGLLKYFPKHRLAYKVKAKLQKLKCLRP